MTYTVTINNARITLGPGNLYFRGYLNHRGKLLYDEQAEVFVSAILLGKSPTELFNTINGAFRFVYLKDNFLYFSVDHFGGYSLFYKITGKAIELFDNPMQHPSPGKLNDTAVCTLLATGFTLGQDTLFEDVLECDSGILYKFDCGSGKLSSTRWFGYYSFNEKSLVTAKLQDLIGNLFPVPEQGEYTLSLSGGVDSRLLLGAMLKQEKPFKTFSFGSSLNQDKLIANQLTAHFKISHQQHDFTPEICSRFYNDKDLDFILRNCTSGRSLPNETDLISSRLLDPAKDIIVKGFGGDWLTGRYMTPTLMKQDTEDKLTRYLFGKYFRLTCFSSPAFKNLLWEEFNEIMQVCYLSSSPGLVSCEEQWNLHHNERKYIINTLAYYKAAGFRFYLPYFDRHLMHYFSRIKYVDKIDQNGYFKFLSKSYFIEKFAALKEIPTLRENFLAPIALSGLQKAKISVHDLLRDLDKKKLRKRLATPSLNEYADSLMLFTHELKALPYLKNTVAKNFPDITAVSHQFKEMGCPLAAKHLDWLSRQATSQMNINGLSLSKFFFNQPFLSFLKSISA